MAKSCRLSQRYDKLSIELRPRSVFIASLNHKQEIRVDWVIMMICQISGQLLRFQLSAKPNSQRRSDNLPW